MDDNRENDLPDFKQLDDRLIAQPPTSPILAIRTNLDKEPNDIDNPYVQQDSKPTGQNKGEAND
ncbi:hypothetical protein ABE237_07390 [Brevibacillus formosus]|uniref:hypothetical protein n=1 Tax=Brevibacillus TaxID=55080 RepID=UPI000D10EB7B|nr:MULTISPECIES: hypothetical protein [Brevibacillus]MBG9943399.1 hypothetical protein [Brevibacillus formosus]MBW5467713.1 hypothetical protein [Brevibacillus formosus]MED1947940.1 hypothetical protein [Brevibacillus formosus]MED1998329.1 hypothetical protein [Brevibacillus formosus]MED2080870.1 hypothetical protein [Brevibacillus formosus]